MPLKVSAFSFVLPDSDRILTVCQPDRLSSLGTDARNSKCSGLFLIQLTSTADTSLFVGLPTERKRGRPKGSTNQKASSTDALHPTQRRPVGRPTGSGPKQRAAAALKLAIIRLGSNSAGNDVDMLREALTRPKRPLGRPKKDTHMRVVVRETGKLVSLTVL